MTKAPVLAVDFDNVLFDFNRHFVEFHNREYGTSLRYEDVDDHANFHRFYDCPREELARRVSQFDATQDYSQLLPIEGAVEATRELAEIYDLHIITARQEHGRSTVSPWLDTFFGKGVFTELHFANAYITDHTIKVKTRSKGELCRSIGAVGLVEDAPEHADSAVQAGVPVLLKDKPWNQQVTPHELIERFSHWLQVDSILRSWG